jgi:hypothetical protein
LDAELYAYSKEVIIIIIIIVGKTALFEPWDKKENLLRIMIFLYEYNSPGLEEDTI